MTTFWQQFCRSVASRSSNRSPLEPYRAGFALAGLLCLSLAACGGSKQAGAPSQSGATISAPVTALAQLTLSPAAQLGEKIFSDPTLSASGRLSCASCHNPATAHAPSNDLATQLGGIDQRTGGTRAAPSLRYLAWTPGFLFGPSGLPTGGFDRDGRAATLAEQAQRPFLAAHEMANADAAAVVAHLRQSAYAETFRQVFGSAVLDDPAQAFARIGFALQQYQKEDRDFAPFDAKYDQFLAGKVNLNPAELRGLALFNNRAKGNCIACHPSTRSTSGAAPLFTDFSYDNLGVPRNRAIAANADAEYFDLGLCGPDRTDLSGRSDLCGKFKVPTLRNVATRKVFFHNGRFTSLREVISFYVRRDTNPEEWYPRNADGSINQFDDLPPAYRRNVNRSEVPYNRSPDMAPALSPSEIEDVIAFLGTLTDADQIIR